MADAPYPEVLETISAAVAGVLVDRGVEIAAAREAGQVAAERVRQDFGGFQVYVPSGKMHALSARDREIYAAWKPGENEFVLCRQYDITERHLRRIVEARRAEDRATRQGSLGLDN